MTEIQFPTPMDIRFFIFPINFDINSVTYTYGK